MFTGAVIGAICACVTYNIYWHSPFYDGHKPRMVYTTDTHDPNLGYELAQLDDDTNV